MLKDARGLDVTTSSSITVAAINRLIVQALTYGQDMEAEILAGVAADPTCAIANAYVAAYYLSQESVEARAQALIYLQTATQNLAGATKREELYVRGIAAWAVNDIDRAIAYHESMTDQFPQDLLAVQQGQYHYFYKGDQAGLLRIARKVLPANSDNPYLLGMLAFGLEQCYQLAEAERIARYAVALNPQNPWAHHAIAHVLEAQGRIEEGIAWMETAAETWECCNSMLYTHNWWHVALFYLKQGDQQKVLNLYDTHIWGRARKASPKDQVGAISLLLRSELQGIDAGRRWVELKPYLLPRRHEHTLPFQDLHFVYALAKSGQLNLAKEMLLSMQTFSQTLLPAQKLLWMEVVLPAAKGMLAHAQGDWRGTLAHFAPIRSHLRVVGGSHTQQEMFEQVFTYAQSRLRQIYKSSLADRSWAA